MYFLTFFIIVTFMDVISIQELVSVNKILWRNNIFKRRYKHKKNIWTVAIIIRELESGILRNKDKKLK